MNIDDFLETKVIHMGELEANFDLIDEYKKDMTVDKFCPACSNELNAHWYKSAPWAAVCYCVSCKRISLVIWSDRMGETYTDTVKIYGDR